MGTTDNEGELRASSKPKVYFARSSREAAKEGAVFYRGDAMGAVD